MCQPRVGKYAERMEMHAWCNVSLHACDYCRPMHPILLWICTSHIMKFEWIWIFMRELLLKQDTGYYWDEDGILLLEDMATQTRSSFSEILFMIIRVWTSIAKFRQPMVLHVISHMVYKHRIQQNELDNLDMADWMWLCHTHVCNCMRNIFRKWMQQIVLWKQSVSRVVHLMSDI